MTFFKRAQTATEYLIILAVVIIIALIALSVLGVVPGIGKDSKGGAKQAFWSTAKISVFDVGWSASGNESFSIRNNMPETVVVRDIYLGTTKFNRRTIFEGGNTTSITLAPGETHRYSLADNSSTYWFNVSWPDGDCVAGEAVALYFTFEYADATTQMVYNYSANDEEYATTCAS